MVGWHFLLWVGESRRDTLRRDHVTFSEGFILFARQRASSEIFHDALLLTIFVVVSQSTGMSHYTELIEMRNYYSRVSKNDSHILDDPFETRIRRRWLAEVINGVRLLPPTVTSIPQHRHTSTSSSSSRLKRWCTAGLQHSPDRGSIFPNLLLSLLCKLKPQCTHQQASAKSLFFLSSLRNIQTNPAHQERLSLRQADKMVCELFSVMKMSCVSVTRIHLLPCFHQGRCCEPFPLVICLAVTNELASHLPLQMLLFFNMFYFPCWWFSAAFMLEVKVSSLFRVPSSRQHQLLLSARCFLPARCYSI